jgi:hypothetical protein
MDNTRDLPGYKYYVDPQTGERPAVYVAYVDLVPDPTAAVDGVVFEPTNLPELDVRERNYERREVTSHVSPPVGGCVWAYFGTEAAHERFDRGLRTKTAVIAREYLDKLRHGVPRFDASTDPPPVPIRDLRRIDIPQT